jgi:predicted transposase YbfD/YdcC
MGKLPVASMEHHFCDLQDPRIERSKLHKLLDIVVIAICAVICGADGWVEVELFGNAKWEWLKRFLELPNGIPSHDTFGRVFAALDTDQFRDCFLRWIAAVSELTRGQVIAMDGKTLRRSHDRGEGKEAIAMVSAWAAANRLVLGQVKVNDKSNEITAIPELLRVLDVSGCIVTIDAMGCQTEIASSIVARGAAYILALKENQPHSYEDVKLLFDDLEQSQFRAYRYDYARLVDKGHGRIEIRQCWTISDPKVLGLLRKTTEWDELGSVIKIQAERRIGSERSVEDRYYLSSLDGNAQELLNATRTHWQIENGLHWVLDIAFREDDCRIRKDHGAENFAILRHIALNLLKQETTVKKGIKAKRLKAGWDEQYLLKILSGLFV